MKDDRNEPKAFFEVDSNKKIGDYFTYLDNISKALSKRLDDLENENIGYKNEILELEKNIEEKDKLIQDYEDQISGNDTKVNELIEKLEKEQRRTKVLEVENTRNMDELKSLRKENKSLLIQSSDNERVSLIQRIKRKFK